MNEAALCFRRALTELIENFQKDPHDHSWGPYWTEQEKVCDLTSSINRSIDRIIDDEKGEGSKWPIGAAAEVKFSYRSSTSRRSWPNRSDVKTEISKDIERLRDLKEEGLCKDAFFFYLDEYNIGNDRKKVEGFLKEKCRDIVSLHYEGENLYGPRKLGPRQIRREW